MVEEKEREKRSSTTLRILCRNKLLSFNFKEAGIQWLVGSQFLPFTIISTLRCLHHTPKEDPFSPNYDAEADDLSSLLPKGFMLIGAIYVADGNGEADARKAASIFVQIRRKLSQAGEVSSIVSGTADIRSGEIKYFIFESGNTVNYDEISSVLYEEDPEDYLWRTGCLLRCQMPITLPVYFPSGRPSDAKKIFSSAVDNTVSNLRGQAVAFMVKGADGSEDDCITVVQNADLESTDIVEKKDMESDDGEKAKIQRCASLCSKDKIADPIQVEVFINRSKSRLELEAPIADYIPANEPSKLLVVSLKLDVLCYASKYLPVASAIVKLIVPGLADQLSSMRKAFLPELSTRDSQLCPYHFLPPGIPHPVTAIYELSYGETEQRQVEVRKQLHLRLQLPLDRPLLLAANSLSFSSGRNQSRKDTQRLKDVHTSVQTSGVSGRVASLVQGSYEYYHYLQDGINDNGWGCAYRSLQTIVSWFKLQHYTSIDVPSHRDIQKTLVEIGDKDASFIGSRDWIGAIELSFVLDKLLGVSCKVINVRSGAELPEKCRELALHFESQGTPVMIGGGVLAYTLLGIDYNEHTGDCAFLILDPHYTGNEDLGNILNGGWCGWKKAVDSKGTHFFLHDKFYNLLLPQRPNMV